MLNYQRVISCNLPQIWELFPVGLPRPRHPRRPSNGMAAVSRAGEASRWRKRCCKRWRSSSGFRPAKLNGSVFGKRCVVCNRNSIKNSKLVEIFLNMTGCMISHLLLYISLHSPNFIREALKPRPSLIHRPSQHSSAEAKSSVGDTIRQSCSLGQQVNPALNSLWLRKKARNGMMEARRVSWTCTLATLRLEIPHMSKCWISHEK